MANLKTINSVQIYCQMQEVINCSQALSLCIEIEPQGPYSAIIFERIPS